MSEAIDPQKQIDAETVRSVLDYCQSTGVFTWRKMLSPRGPVGRIAGNVCIYGYRIIRIGGRAYKAHRLAWLHVHGAMPLNCIDHINGDKDDNRIKNLRDVDKVTNAQNIRHARGILFDKRTGRWYAQLSINGSKKHIGSFADAKSAHAAYIAAKRIQHKGCTI